jgi:hypothetical protein
MAPGCGAEAAETTTCWVVIGNPRKQVGVEEMD